MGSEEMVSINHLAQLAIDISNKDLTIFNIDGNDFIKKYGFECPLGVKGRNSDNKLYKKKMDWEPQISLMEGMSKTYEWINDQVLKK